jgi:hypothetical protein
MPRRLPRAADRGLGRPQMQRADTAWRGIQGRVCPLPRTRYLKVQS